MFSSVDRMRSMQPAYVDMKPDLVLLTDVSDGVERIEGSEDGRSAGRRHEERNCSIAFSLPDLLLEVGGYHFSAAAITYIFSLVSCTICLITRNGGE